ncbi:unnamed protein product [Alopecurus aequalis]
MQLGGQQQEKKGKVKKGWLAVRVGDEQFQRFVIPIAYLYHPLFLQLLEAARDTYGYDSAGPLRLPCSVDEFLRHRAIVEQDTPTSSAHSTSSHRVPAGHHQHNSVAPCARTKIAS